MNARTVNTSNKANYGKNLENDTPLEIYQTNFLIIREMFNLIKDKRVSNSDFYAYIFDMDKSKAEVIMTSIVNTGYGDIEKYSKKLIEYGLSKEYFSKENPEFIQASEFIINNYRDYLITSKITKNEYDDTQEELAIKEIEREEQQELRIYNRKILLEDIFTVKNKDGSLVIDCLRNILLDYLEINKKAVSELYDMSAHIVDTTATAFLSQKQIQQYYIYTTWNFTKYDIADLSGKVNSKKIYGKKSNGFTFYLIRETYQILSQIDANRPDALERFYNYLEISEADYQSIIDSNLAPNKKMADLLTPFKYPASLFRGDTPAEYDVSDDIKSYYKEYYCNGDYDLFNNALTVYLCYKISSDNIGLVMPTLALINHLYPEN